eukprot:8675191-Pyramimonas_sp.AAC.1
MQAGLPSPFWTHAVRSIFCLCYKARIPEKGESSWRRRFGHYCAAPLLPFGSFIRFMPPPASRLRIAKTGGAMISGINFGYAQKAGCMVGPESYVTPIRQLDGLNMETGRTPAGKRQIIEKSDQAYSNILGGTVPDQEP